MQIHFLSIKLKLNIHYSKKFEKKNITLKLASLVINKEINRISSIEFMGVLINEHLFWKERITVSEKNSSKNLDIRYRAKKSLDASALRKLYFFYIVI